MPVKELWVWKGLVLAFILCCINGETSEPSFMVTFPAVIESGSEPKLCASLLKLNESLVMNIYLVHGDQSTLLLQEKAEEEFHRCFNFQTPLIEAESVQTMKVELQGKNFKMIEERKVMFRRYNPLTFIQTDKPIYIPGQTVFFRVITMDASFVPLDQMYSMVVVEDSEANRIGQWTNISSTKWILQLSHELNPEASQGMYKLKAFIGERMITHDFEVKKYVLPKFEVTIKAPKTQSAGDVEMKIEVCGKYTYGQPVPGNAWVEVCCHSFEYFSFSDVICPCLNKTAQMNKTGCASCIFNTSAFLNPRFEDYHYFLGVRANVTEEGTDTVLTKSEHISLTYEIGKVTFADLPDLFEHGSVIEGKIKVAHFNGTPIHSKAVFLLEGRSWSSRLLQNLTTDSNGLATFSLNTASLPNSDIHLMASVTLVVHHNYNTPYFTTDEKTVRLLQPATPHNPTLSELIIENIEQPLKCDAEFTVTIKYYFIGETVEEFKTDIVYMVLSRGKIIHHGFEKVEVKSSNGAANGTVLFKLSVGADLAPAVQILAYCVLPSQNVVARSTEFDTEKCFENKVSLQFSPAKAVPGEKNTLQLSAQPGSLCGLSAVDQSVLIMESGKRLDTDKIFNLLARQMVSDYPYDQQECLNVRSYHAVLTDNTYESLKRVGLKMATNLAVRPQCFPDNHFEYDDDDESDDDMEFESDPIFHDMLEGASLAVRADLGQVNSPFDVTIRTVFPETWIWQLAEVGESGSAQVPVTVPDTITSWETEAFCLSSKGLGLAPPAQLTVFQPFFLELSLPYSIIRGEIFELKATVFNYLSKCIMVKVTPDPSSDYTLKASSDDQYSSCLCANGRKTFKWILTPSVLGVLNITVSAEAEASQTVCDNEIVSVPERGRIDSVTQSLLVQAEGTEKTDTYSWLLCPKGDSLSEEVDLTLPKDVIEGSARSSVSVIGDILGRALTNLHGLLQMPYGCGEQNMAILSPNIYILQYLENTEQLTSAIRERATGFLKSGYQRQLNYRHNSGAYSTFGHGDENTWLTAFVLRSFGKAQKYIFIDPQIIQSAKEWLISRRDSDGCFIQQGTLFHNRMKGGVNDNVTMTAYITASLLELETSVTDVVVTKGLSCLRSIIEDVKNTYTTALLAYTFSLARDTDTRQQLFKKLEEVAISDGSHVHWSQSASDDDSGSLAVEISSYVLLAVLSTDSVTTADLGFANRIVSWLVKQQNAYGGFSSTQDTVVALQALSLYATKVFSSDGSSTVTVQSAGDTHHFDVNQDNKLLYQEKQLQNVPGKYSIEVKGSTCVSVQITLLYNIPTPLQAIKTLSVEARVTGDCLTSAGQNLMMNFTVIYNGTQASTNMVIVDIKLLSGFTADTSMLKKAVHRVESNDDHVIMYLEEVQKNKLFRQMLHIKQIFSVKNLKPAVVKVYDYYQTMVNSTESCRSVGTNMPVGGTSPPGEFFINFQEDWGGPLKGGSLKASLQYKLIAVQDSRKNRINQWINATSTHGRILQLSHTLNPEAPVGSYELLVETSKQTIKENFQVKEYVLPKFEVKLHKPKIVRAHEEEVKLGVCGRYTHRHPVQGSVKMGLCKTTPVGFYYSYQQQTALCVNKSAILNDTGCVSEMFPISFFIRRSEVYLMPLSLEFTASVTEEGTDITMERTEKVFLTYTIGSIKFIDLPEFFEKGSAIQAKVKVELSKGTPFPYFKVVVHYDLSQPQELTTDINGLAHFTIDTSLTTSTSIYVSAYASFTNQFSGPFNFESAYKTLQLKSKESLAKASQLVIKALEEPLMCEEEISVTVQYTIDGETIESGSVTIVYLVSSREEIVHHGYKNVKVNGSDGVVEGEAMFKVPVRTQMAPKMEFLAYCVLPSEIVLADSRTFQTEKCFENKVSLQFSPTTAVPGEENTLQISAQPGSLCGLTAVDQSVLIMESGKRLDADKVFTLLPARLFPYDIEDQEDCFNIRSRRSPQSPPPYSPMPSYPYHSESKADAVYASFRNMGLKVVTNLIIKMPSCIKFRDVFYQRMFGGFLPPIYGGIPGGSMPRIAGLGAGPLGVPGAVVPAVGVSSVGLGIPAGGVGVAAGGIGSGTPLTPLIPEETIRTFFPETWIWELIEIGDSGSAQVPVTVPDTITSWETEAFCLSSKGLGLAPPAQLTVFQPFFLELSLPYSIIRGEIFELKATVFNYLSKCIMVKVTPAPSSDYTLKASSDDQYSSCLCANGRKTFKWILTPSVLGVLNITVGAEAEASQTVCDNEIVSVPERGRIDTVTQSLRVNAGGIEKTNTHSWLLCPKGQKLTEEVDLAFPKNLIEGSGRATVSVLGDILGRALNNLDGLLRMPYGCAEQNIAVLSPNIYILQYLENTEQLTSAIRERATGFLKSGYQRQLNYENSDGSYSTFGRGDGNTWLTAFVLRTFGKAQRYIFIDPQKIQNSKQWLISHQRPDGSYESRGKLFNNRMKGGVSDDVTITAYITASLLELNTSATDPAVSKGLSYLKHFVGDIQNTYTTALLAYTFSLARDTDTRQHFFKKLEGVAISEGSHLHWSQSASDDDSDSLAVEISSYVLLAVLTTDSVTAADLGFANRIFSWLVKQQNAYGGFSSTQDTVVALQALSLYATKVFSSDGSSTVTVQSAGDTHHFDVNQDNKLLYQEKQLQNVPGKYSIEVKGSTCVSVQMSLFFNIPTPKESKALQIFAKSGGVCQPTTGQILDVILIVMYTGTQDSSNMVIVDMKLLSGFKLEPSSLDALKKVVHRVESKDDHVIIYLQELPKNMLFHQMLRIKQIFSVKNLKPAVVKVYDYYQTSERSEAEYFNHCA
ncbi:hypothetical protein Q8A67_018402 [Cirrhinus molitorella]|uniref:Alpha-2-macroglobulin-like n=2 Tax=Cirrhinus TaxID=59897 RepID=A0AA88PG03_9TELE|nr:hypothetical protein Q8A67_018402 [Cirrhinus molitorella]